MAEDAFLSIVRRNATFESESEAESIAEATLSRLGTYLTRGEMEDVAERLPGRWAAAVRQSGHGGTPPARDEFLAEIRDEATADREDVVSQVQAVFTAVATMAGEEELANAQAQFPPEYELLFEPAEALAQSSFVDLVAGHAGLDSTERARNAARAGLRTLGERLSRGEAEDLAAFLPPDAEEWVVPDEREESVALSREEFLDRVAEREDEPREVAVEHARAVFAALEDTVGDEEYERARSQLPPEYDFVAAA